MARQRFSVEQIIHKLREADVELAKSTAVRQVCRHDADVDANDPWAAQTTTQQAPISTAV